MSESVGQKKKVHDPKRGRPALAVKRNTPISLNTWRTLKESIQELAARNRTSMARYVEGVLTEHVSEKKG